MAFDAEVQVVIKTKNKIGPKTEPCGTPLRTVNQSDNVPRQLTARSCGPSATSGLLVFISEVALSWKKDYGISGKLLAFGFVATMRLLSY